MINKKRLIDQFVECCKIYSPTGGEAEFAEYIVRKLVYVTDIVKKDSYGNVCCRLDGSEDNLFFAAHMDTVEPCKNVTPIVSNDKITSDGTTILGADNKAAITSIIETLMVLKEKKINHKTIEIIFTRSEEIGNFGAINFDYSLLSSKNGYCFDSILPVGTIITASPYYETFDITIIGQEVHSAYSSGKVNTVKILGQIINELHLGKIDQDTIINVGIITAGHARNTLPGEIIIRGEIRSYVYSRISREKKYVSQIVKNISKKNKIRIKIEFEKENDGYVHKSKKSVEFVDKTVEIIKSLDITPTRIESWAVSDANIFNFKNRVCLNLGDGVQYAHSKKEMVKIVDLENLVKLMIALTKN